MEDKREVTWKGLEPSILSSVDSRLIRLATKPLSDFFPTLPPTTSSRTSPPFVSFYLEFSFFLSKFIVRIWKITNLNFRLGRIAVLRWSHNPIPVGPTPTQAITSRHFPSLRSFRSLFAHFAHFALSILLFHSSYSHLSF